MNQRCLYCYSEISADKIHTEDGQLGFHPQCSKKIFGSTTPPVLGYTQSEITELAKEVVRSQVSLTGVQPKLSLGLVEAANGPDRLTIIGVWGSYILKPQTSHYPYLPENEDLTMHLAELSKIATVPHTLIRLKSGELAYLTKRVDRQDDYKLPMEDMCQLTERLTEHKYRGSYEQIAKTIQNFSANPGLDIVNFYEVVLFSFLVGNNDMHLKNFSLLKSKLGYTLSPAYDLLASALVIEEDNEELALTLNGKKRKLTAADFETAVSKATNSNKVAQNLLRKYAKLLPKWEAFIKQSFLPIEIQEAYLSVISSRAKQLNF